MGSDARDLRGRSRAEFQSTLPHGERLALGYAFARCIPFQSTLPHGERPAHGWRLCLRKVSIHAPTWGATKIDHAGENNKMFQSTLPHGERLELIDKICAEHMFQSTLPHGERLIVYSISKEMKVFQSTLPHGERHLPSYS